MLAALLLNYLRHLQVALEMTKITITAAIAAKMTSMVESCPDCLEIHLYLSRYSHSRHQSQQQNYGADVHKPYFT